MTSGPRSRNSGTSPCPGETHPLEVRIGLGRAREFPDSRSRVARAQACKQASETNASSGEPTFLSASPAAAGGARFSPAPCRGPRLAGCQAARRPAGQSGGQAGSQAVRQPVSPVSLYLYIYFFLFIYLFIYTYCTYIYIYIYICILCFFC